jgi:hypothetical protein
MTVQFKNMHIIPNYIHPYYEKILPENNKDKTYMIGPKDEALW